MDNQNLTEIVVIVDKSGSMERIREDAIGGFNCFLRDQQQMEGNALLTLVLFDQGYHVVHQGTQIQDVPPLSKSTFRPSGATALLDALGRTIDAVDSRIQEMAKNERPSNVLVAILTDGRENASSDYTRPQVFNQIKILRQQDWTFLFLAANQNAITEASQYGISNAIGFNHSSAGVRGAYTRLSALSTRVRRERKPKRDNDLLH